MRLGRVSRRWRTVRLCCVMNSRTIPIGTSSPRALASSNSSRSACALISRSRWARIEEPRVSGLSAPSSPSLTCVRATHMRHFARSYFPWPSRGIPSRTNRCTVRGVMPSTRASLSTLTSFANQCPHRGTQDFPKSFHSRPTRSGVPARSSSRSTSSSSICKRRMISSFGTP